mgnify:CR=1 FL=1
MKTITTILLVLWVLIVLDSTGAVLCKFSKACVDLAQRFSILAKFTLKDSSWPYLYLGLAVFGLITVLLLNKEIEKEDREKDS